jgi:hypothetical protein
MADAMYQTEGDKRTVLYDGGEHQKEKKLTNSDQNGDTVLFDATKDQNEEGLISYYKVSFSWCIYTYICIYMYTCIYVYIYMYTYRMRKIMGVSQGV